MFVTSYCQHCGGGIEFDAENFAEENSLVQCPHCGFQTRISLPSPGVLPSAVGFSSTGAERSAGEEKPNVARYFRLLRKAAALGDTQSMANLGVGLLSGNEYPRNPKDGAMWLCRAAERGDATAQNNLGCCYETGDGVLQDYGQAGKWYRNAADQGNADGLYHLGGLYYRGFGLPKDARLALDSWLKAAEQWHLAAQNNVSLLYSEGLHVTQDFVEAYKWMALAAERGFPGALSDSTELAARMKAAELVDARRRVESFKLVFNERVAPSGFESMVCFLAAAGDLEAQFLLRGFEVNSVRQPIPSDVRREVWRRDEGKCVKCGSRIRLEYDHIIPVSKGGGNTARNIELLCESCNRAKSASIQ